MRRIVLVFLLLVLPNITFAQSQPLCVEGENGISECSIPDFKPKPRTISCRGPVPDGFNCQVTTAGTPKPSFSCSAARTEVELQVCQDVLLADMDAEMTGLYIERRARLSGVEASSFVNQQRLWLRWRDTCSIVDDCLQRRYEQRIVDLAEPGKVTDILGRAYRTMALQAAMGNNSQQATARLGNGRYELVFPDGTVEWEAFDGGERGVERPDGTGSRDSSSNAIIPSFPVLPIQFQSWGNSIEEGLLGIIDTVLPERDHAGYRALQTGFDYSQRVRNHIRTIKFLLDR